MFIIQSNIISLLRYQIPLFTLSFYYYIWFIFPSTFQAAIKIQHYGYSISVYQESVPNVNIIFPIPYFRGSGSIVCQASTFSLLTMLLITYYITLIFGIPTPINTSHTLTRIPFALLVNAMDLFLFRYFSSFIIDVFSRFFTDFNRSKDLKLNVASIVFFILYVVFIFTSYNHILRAVVLLNISNPLLVNENQRYPYDYYSWNYSVYCLFLKALIALKYNYILTIDTINSVIVSLNICIILLSFTLLFNFSIVNLYINFSCGLFYANFELNYFRNALVIFNSFICLFTLILGNSHILVLLILSFNITLLVLYYEYQLLFKNLFEKQNISYKLLLLLMIRDINNSAFFDYRPIISSWYTKHLDLCYQGKCAFCLNHTKSDLKSYIEVFYKYLKKERKKSQTFFEEISTLLYSKLKMKSVKVFRLYYYFIRKYEKKDKLNAQTIRIIVEDWLIKDNNDHSLSIQRLIQMTKLEYDTKALRSNMNDFFIEDLKTKKPETIIEVSNSIRGLITQFESITAKNSIETEESSNQINENTKKAINEWHYELFI